MGNDLYLTRLVLGRSAFEEVGEQTDVPPADGATDTDTDNAFNSDGQYVQQYNAKGRPINPATERYNASMRQAMNEVLALVGVVERKDAAEAKASWQANLAHQNRKSLLEQEHDCGNNISLLVTSLRELNICWPNAEAILFKLLAGVYDAHTPFATVLLQEWRRFKGHGVKGALVALNAGAVAEYIAFYAQVFFNAGLEDLIVIPLEYRIVRQRWRFYTQQHAMKALKYFCDIVSVTFDALLLPLNYYAYVQLLGLASPTRILPPLSLLSPFHPTSFHTFGWRSPFASSIQPSSLGILLSPAFLLLASTTLTRTQDQHGPRLTLFTCFRYNVTATESAKFWTDGGSFPDNHGRRIVCGRRTSYLQDPLYFFFEQARALRCKLEAWVGYTIERSRQDVVDAETGSVDERVVDRSTACAPEATDDYFLRWDGREQKKWRNREHRASQLARAVPDYLTEAVDSSLERLLLLPFQTLLLRSVALAAAASSATAADGLHGRRLWPESADGLWKALFSDAAGRRSAWGFVGKIGLALALQAAGEVGWLGLTYALAKWQGLKNYGWSDDRGKSLEKETLKFEIESMPSTIDDDPSEGPATAEEADLESQAANIESVRRTDLDAMLDSALAATDPTPEAWARTLAELGDPGHEYSQLLREVEEEEAAIRQEFIERRGHWRFRNLTRSGRESGND